MNTSVIQYRVADFLKRYAPFDSLPEAELLDLAASGRVKFHESEEYIFQQGYAIGSFLWVIQQGTVELVDKDAERETLRDVLAEGDLLGLDRFAGGGSHLYSARTATDVILYSIDATRFEALTSRYSTVKAYLAAHFSVSAAGIGRHSWLDAPLPPLSFLRARSPAPSLNGVAPPTVCVGSTSRDAVREMVHGRSEVVAITADGGANSPIEALLKAGDLELFCYRNPARHLREIREAGSIEELAPLVQQGRRLALDGLARSSDVDDCLLIATEFAAAAAESCIRLAKRAVAASGIDDPGTRCCWVAFGNLARGELLQTASPKIAVVHDDAAGSEMSQASAYFAAVAGRTATLLYACGIEEEESTWPEGSHACMPVSEWKRFYRETIETPIGHDLFGRREFFDARLLSGDETLLEKLQLQVAAALAGNDSLIPLLANDTLSRLPPLTFFRGLVMDMDGTQRTSFDLTDFVLNPISDAARVFTLRRNGTRIQTLDRLASAAIEFPASAAVFQDAADAFRIALYYRALFPSAAIEPSKLGQYDRRLIKTTFSSILRLLELTASTFAGAA